MALSSTCLKNGILEIRITDLGCYALIKKKEQKKKEWRHTVKATTGTLGNWVLRMPRFL
jgi:hypothetical protein